MPVQHRRKLAPTPTLTPIAGERVGSRLRNGVQTIALDITVEATVNVTTVGTGIRNRGSILAAYDEAGITADGGDKWTLGMRELRAFAEGAAPSSLSSTRLTAAQATALGNYALRESFRLYFAHPYALNPMETAFREANPLLPVEFFAKLSTNAFANLVAGGAGTVTGHTIRVRQHYDKDRTALPLFIPTARKIVVPVTQAETQKIVELNASRAIRAVLVSTTAVTVGEVSDVVNKFALRGDTTDIIGPQAIAWKDMFDSVEGDHGGAIGFAATNGAHLLLNMQDGGQLSSTLNPAQDLNLRFEFDCQPSVTAGAGASSITLTLFELDRTPGADRNGNPIVEPTLPF